MCENETREKIIALARSMNATGLNQGTSGNISARVADRMLITPSGVPYDDMTANDIASMAIDSDLYEWQGPYKPSSEWHFHRAILQNKQSAGAVVHTHSSYATALSIARVEIPACHYMIAAFGGETVRCADYATFGTPQLSEVILAAMKDRTACLMANHGMVVTGADLDSAMWAATELETLAKQYHLASSLKCMTVLPTAEIETVLEAFKDYGPQSKNAGS